MSAQSKKDQDRDYPWVELLDLSLRTGGEPEEPKVKRGRPRSRIERKKLTTTLTPVEKEILNSLSEKLGERFGRYVPQGHIIGFMLHRLEDQLRQGREVNIPKNIDSFRDLMNHLDENC
jgi:hypothetical protein